MNYSRKTVLSKFFGFHGVLANQYEIYKDMVLDNLCPNPTYPHDEKDCIYHSKNYDVKNEEEDYEVPMMTDKGYFIIQGIPKVPLIQESKSRSSIFFAMENTNITAETRFPGSRSSMKLVYSKEIYIRILEDGTFKKMHLSCLLSLWDKTSVLEEDTYIVAFKCMSGKKREAEVMSVFTDEIEGEISEDLYSYFEKYILGTSTVLNALYTIVYMVSKCISIKLGSLHPTDRDNYGFKVFHSSGNILSSLIRRAVKKKAGNIRRRIDDEVYSVMKTGTLEINNVKKSKMVIQVGNRSTLDTISSIRRVVVPADDNSMNYNMRQMHHTQRGFICPSETPEGKQVGLTKNLAMTCVISPRMENLYDTIVGFSNKDPGPWLILDGLVVGFSDKDAYRGIRMLKRKYHYLSVDVGDELEVNVRTYGGRLMRPLVVTNERVVPWNKIDERSWRELLETGMIEYLDPLEVDLKRTADLSYGGTPEKFTHMEIHPYTMLGIAASTLPFINHNHGARSIFASSMIKQAMECPPLPDVDSKFLVYAQKPLVYTATQSILGLNPNGINLLVTVMSYTGYNQEDAIMMKKSFAERGGFSSIGNKIKRLDQKHSKREIVIQERDEENVITISDYSKVKSENTIWTIDGASERIVNKYSSNKLIRDDAVCTTRHNIPRVGDKLSTRHAQKGVIGRILQDQDMPFTEDGMIPDIIVNPHGVPSRMTMGQMIEGLLGRRCSIDGKFEDGTAFNPIDISDKIDDKVTFINGMTGETMSSMGTIDVVYGIALHHMVIDKIYYRSVGPINEFSHQPVSGRSKEGGLRFGEMEFDLLIAHGASSSIQNTIRNSDMETFRVCRRCKYFPIEDACCVCDGTSHVEIEMPYAIKVLKDLMHINNINFYIEDM